MATSNNTPRRPQDAALSSLDTSSSVVVLIIAIALCIIALVVVVAPSVAYAETPPPRTSGEGDERIQEESKEIVRIGIDAYARQEQYVVLPETGGDLTAAANFLFGVMVFLLIVIVIGLALKSLKQK
jgi:heme/copper-type cytochrome/quinol oxidase subunit 4